VTLRARLSIAFTVLLLGPLLLAVIAIAAAGRVAGAVDTDAGARVRAVVAARCAHLDIVARGLAATASAQGLSWAVTPSGAVGPWAICGAGQPSTSAGVAVSGLAARAEIRDVRGEVAGYAYAVTPVDPPLLAELSAAAGSRVVPAANAPPDAVPMETYVDQPLSLALAPRPAGSVPDPAPVIATAAGVAVLFALLLGWWVGGVATRPMRVLLGTVDRAAAGDFEARSGMVGRDETGRLSSGLDRLIAGMQETQRLSVTDALTGLGNVRQLAESLRLEIERATRFHRSLGVLMLDLDHFKAVNDEHGHRAGDAVLVEFARRVRRAIREVDLAFRQGGEEFVILLPETDLAGSLTAARRVGEAVRDVAFTVPARPGGSSGWIPITVSIGIAVYPRHGLTAIDLLDAADQALYAAKDAGRDTFAVAPLHASIRRESPATGGELTPTSQAPVTSGG
jgi:two-component system cell cycle response regulator